MGDEARQWVAVSVLVFRGEPMAVIVFRAESQAGEVILSEEHDAYRWCELTELGVPAQLVDAARDSWPIG